MTLLTKEEEDRRERGERSRNPLQALTFASHILNHAHEGGEHPDGQNIQKAGGKENRNEGRLAGKRKRHYAKERGRENNNNKQR